MPWALLCFGDAEQITPDRVVVRERGVPQYAPSVDERACVHPLLWGADYSGQPAPDPFERITTFRPAPEGATVFVVFDDIDGRWVPVGSSPTLDLAARM